MSLGSFLFSSEFLTSPFIWLIIKNFYFTVSLIKILHAFHLKIHLLRKLPYRNKSLLQRVFQFFLINSLLLNSIKFNNFCFYQFKLIFWLNLFSLNKIFLFFWCFFRKFLRLFLLIFKLCSVSIIILLNDIKEIFLFGKLRVVEFLLL